MRDANGNFVDMLGHLDPYGHGGGNPSRLTMAAAPTPEQVEDQIYLDANSEKRLVQTSPPYPSMNEAMDACVGVLAQDSCEYAYVSEDKRVIAIFEFYDVHPSKPVKPGQRRVLIPKSLADRQKQIKGAKP